MPRKRPPSRARTNTKDAARDEAASVAGDEETRPGRALWSGTISFGLVSIPVELHSATRTVRKSLRMLAPSGTPVVRRYFSEEEHEAPSLERGYEVEKGAFVLVTEDELEALAPEESRDIAVTRFVERSAIPPLLFDHPYVLAPAGKSSSAYRLLADTMGESRAGIASFVMRGKQYAVAILADDGLLRAQTLRFADEIRTPSSVGLPKLEAPSAARVKEMTRLVRAETKADVGNEELADPYWEAVVALAKAKEKKHEDVIAFATEEAREGADEEGAEVIDLVALLKKSLGKRTKHASAKAASSRAASSKASTSSKSSKKPPRRKRAAARRK